MHEKQVGKTSIFVFTGYTGWQVELAAVINQHLGEGDSVLQVAKCLELEEQCRDEEKQHWARVAALIQVPPQSQRIISPLPP